ncbi:mercury resistance system transport protein MerF [Hwanghaeella sp.]|uniref:mercury resistance system transport protein MerF n=1 Tax=Hwanghaeella sp. TaxID=2605943 RepID=UPI003CCB9713
MSDRLFKTGVVGSLVAAICCFTPVLGLVLAAVGLSGLIVYADVVLLPALAAFLLITAIALWKRAKRKSPPPPG